MTDLCGLLRVWQLLVLEQQLHLTAVVKAALLSAAVDSTFEQLLSRVITDCVRLPIAAVENVF